MNGKLNEMLTSAAEWHYTASISNLSNTKYDIDNGNVRYELVKTESVSDLGVRFDSKLSFMDHINDKVNKAYGILGIIKRNFYTFGH